MFRRSFSVLVLTAALCGATVLTLGRPDFGLAGQFLGGSYPTQDAAVQVVSILCYVVVAGVALVSVVQAFNAATEAQANMQRSTRAVTFLTLGIVVLGLGMAHRVTYNYPICCGGANQYAQEAASLVR